MPAIEFSTLLNWIVAGLIGLAFGTASALVTYRLERRRDDLKWQRELEKLRIEFGLQAQQRQKEHEAQQREQSRERIEAELTQGLQDPEKEVKSLRFLHALAGDSWRGAIADREPWTSLLESIRARRRYLSSIALFAGLVLGVMITILVYGILAGWHSLG